MIICFCINDLGALGLGATINSLVKNCSDESQLDFYFFCSSVSADVKKLIKNLLHSNSFKGHYKFIDFTPEITFKKYRSLQGDYTTYGRLLIPDVIQDEQIIYLDSDLIIETDILDFKEIDINEKIIGAVKGGSMEFSLENHFYTKILQLDSRTLSFNAGVLLINNRNWNKYSTKKKLLALADKYPNHLLAADQTLLNGFFAGSFFELPSNFNVTWYANKVPPIKSNAIFHFVGSPKPWDFFGKYFHTGYKKWKLYQPKNWSVKNNRRFMIDQLKRFWTIRRSYIKILFSK